MKNHALFSPAFLICFLGLLSLPGLAFPASPLPDQLSGKVTWVYDADTLEVVPHGTVRLLGIDAPEKTGSSRDSRFLSLGVARSQLRESYIKGQEWCIRETKGQQVTLVFDQTRRDRYGRLLAYVYLADGRMLNRTLLEEGLVIVYRRFPFRFVSEFLAAEASARKNRRGLWAMSQKMSYTTSTQATPKATSPPSQKSSH